MRSLETKGLRRLRIIMYAFPSYHAVAVGLWLLVVMVEAMSAASKKEACDSPLYMAASALV